MAGSRALRAAVLGAVLVLAAAPPARALGPFTVDTPTDAADSLPGDGRCDAGGQCTLRAAIQEANASPAEVVEVLLPAGSVDLALEGTDDVGAVGDLDVRGRVTLAGVAGAQAVIDGKAHGRVFQVLAAGSLTLDGVTVRGGHAEVEGAADSCGRRGGAVCVGSATPADAGGTLVARDTTIEANVAPGAGGGIWNLRGSVELVRSTVSVNTSQDSGGGIGTSGGSVLVTNSTVSGNQAAVGGGGIAVFGDVADGTSLTLNNVTVARNQAARVTSPRGGGLWVASAAPAAAVLSNTLLADNTPNDCAGTLTSAGYNLIETPTAGECTLAGETALDTTGGDPALGDLAANGGRTHTHALGATSAARNAASPAPPGAAPACEATDQRRVGRPQGGRCDVGAFELDDEDGDGVVDGADNCPAVANTDQAERDADGVGDACDPCPDVSSPPGLPDRDGDGVASERDCCPDTPADVALAGCGVDDRGCSATDACPCTQRHCAERPDCPCTVLNAFHAWRGRSAWKSCVRDFERALAAARGRGCRIDVGRFPTCGQRPARTLDDRDRDGLPRGADNCPRAFNPRQCDGDGDGRGDPCDADLDGDGEPNSTDLCPAVAADGRHPDTDADGTGDPCDNCPGLRNVSQLDTDGDGFGDVCDKCKFKATDDDNADTDDDGIGDACDCCPGTAAGVFVDCDGCARDQQPSARCNHKNCGPDE